VLRKGVKLFDEKVTEESTSDKGTLEIFINFETNV